MKRPRRLQNWHTFIEDLITDKDIVHPKDLASLLDNTISYQHIAYILRSLGWIRIPREPNCRVSYHRP